MRQSVLRACVTTAAFVYASLFGYAQIVTSNLQGTISDPTGAVIAGARVTALNLDTGAQRETITDAQGFYRLNLLPRGQYEVRAAKAGFADESLKVTLIVGDTSTANLVLKVPGLQ